MSEDNAREVEDLHVACPICGKRVSIGKMNVCYIGRYDCPHCGAVVLIEGDSVKAENNESRKDEGQ